MSVSTQFDITLADLESVEAGPSLADLFATADLIGDRYLTEEEIDERAAILQGAVEAVEDIFYELGG